ncbi:MAG TPA: cytochrome c biogenesis protein CcsA [Clostridia bacterium]|nr:cytochrome c biogenesis protein CcsA [Clostridia bacterium]
MKLIPWFFVALFGAEIIAVMMPKKDGEFHVREFGRLPVLLDGRIQPFDSVARNCLLQIRSTGDVPLEQVPSWKFWHHPKKLKSTEWLLEVMARPEQADTRPIFLIHHAELLGELKLQDKGVEKSGLRYYTFNELKPVIDEVSEQGRKASEVKSEQQNTFQKQVVKLANALMLYQRLKVTLQPEGIDDFPKDLQGIGQELDAAHAAAQASESGKSFDRAAIERLARPIQVFQTMARFGYPLVVPPTAPGVPRDQWQNAGTSLLESLRSKTFHPAVTSYASMMAAYGQQKPEAFNQALEEYQKWLSPRFEKEVKKARAEFYYNDIKAFLHATIIYICAFVLGCGAVLTFGLLSNLSESLRRSAFYLVILAGVVHTFGLVFRMVLEGRPPVTNLYSSAVFIGWGAMLMGLIIERIYRVGIGSLVASLAGFVTLLIAHNLALGGDTMQMLRAVLDTNFWLATHVVVIALGYSAAFFAGLLAILYIFLGVFTPMLNQKLSPSGEAAGKTAAAKIDLGKALTKMVYGVICFTILFSFLGTVLGGIWADQSWGRFWGWDPKENGALLIVLWNAIILHARWGGMVRERGLMNMAIFGNVVTAFSWFGVNMLGIGLHSYGFMDAAFAWLMLFIGTQMAVIGIGLLPLSLWRSFRGRATSNNDRDGRSAQAQPTAV